MTLTTEQKTIQIDTCNVMINREATSGHSENLREVAKIALSTLTANREARPVALVDRRPAASGSICWQNGGKDLPHGTELYTAPPAPAVPQEISSAIRHLKDALVACNRFNYCADAVNRVEDACRAAMLATAPEGGK
ncbi:hypothetical protein PTR34_00845 [Serratia nevei]|uniref:hypothetical protein n=1 Tax=Serratia nevei TaxID=2703794 RepID=UPI00313D2BCB